MSDDGLRSIFNRSSGKLPASPFAEKYLMQHGIYLKNGVTPLITFGSNGRRKIGLQKIFRAFIRNAKLAISQRAKSRT